MTAPSPIHVLYVAAQLPKQSETFVYREVLGLRQRGRVQVSVASVHQPMANTGEPAADALVAQATPVYGAGKWRLVMDAVKALGRPRSWRALGQGISDAFLQRDVALTSRPKVIWQCLAGLAMAHRLRGQRIDHLHAHMAHVPTTIAMYGAMAMGVSFSFTGHAADLFRDRCLLSAKLRRASRVMCISHWHRQFYQRVVTLPDERLPVVRCAVQVSTWRAAASSEATRPAILAVGRLVPKKGFDVLLRSVAMLHHKGMHASCVIVGDGPQRDDLEKLRNELNLQNHVEFSGALPNDMVRQLMQQHRIFALPCRVDSKKDRDGIPVVLMEAMACGAAVISGDLPTIRELIDDGRSGLLVKPDSAQALADALERLLTNSALRSSLGAAARQTVLDEFSLDLNLHRLEAALSAAITGEAPQDSRNPAKTAVGNASSQHLTAATAGE